MPPPPARGHARGPALELHGEGRPRAAHHPARQQHFAIIAAILAISGFVFLILQPRSLNVVADGRDVSISTRRSNDVAVLRSAGIELENGDRLAASTATGDVLEVDRARAVRVTVDGRVYGLRTQASTVQDVLDEAGIVLQQRDSVLQNGVIVSPSAPLDAAIIFVSSARLPDAAPEEAVILEVRRARPFVIVEGGREVASSTSRPTVAQALREAGVLVGPGDVVTPGMQEPMASDTRIEVRRAHAVTLALPGGHRVVYTLALTVREMLEREGIALPQGAFVHPPFDTAITEDLTVRVTQLGSSANEEYEFIESSTVYQADASLPAGETRVVEGQDGVRIRRYEISYVDGQEVGRELVEDRLDPAPVDTIVYYSDRTAQVQAPPQPQAAPRPAESAPSAGARTLRVYATAYNAESAGRSPDDPYYGITATGVRVTWGVVAVDPNVIPLGTRMFIPGYGYAVAADTGGAVKGYIIDLGYPDGVPIDWTSGWIDIQIVE